MEYSQLLLEENNKINIFANMIIKESHETITNQYLFTDYFCDDKKNFKVDKYIFYILLAEKNMEIFMDSQSILNGNLEGGFYNSLITEDNIILLFMRLKIYIFKGINQIEYDSVFQDIFNRKIMNYDNFLEKETLLLEKDLQDDVKKKLIIDEIKKVKLASIGSYLILSYYLYKYDKNKKELLLKFIDKVETIINDYLKNPENLNTDKYTFWNYLISCI